MQVAGYNVLPIFLMPNEEHLVGFSQMGFHVISCVIWMNVIECRNVYVNVCISYIITVTVVLECRSQYE